MYARTLDKPNIDERAWFIALSSFILEISRSACKQRRSSDGLSAVKPWLKAQVCLETPLVSGCWRSSLRCVRRLAGGRREVREVQLELEPAARRLSRRPDGPLR